MAWCQRWFTYFSPSRLCVHSRAGRCLVTNKNQRLFIELDNSLCQTRRIIARLNLWWESAKQETSLVLWVIISSEKQTSSSVFTLRPGELDFCVSFWLLKWVCDTDTVKCWNDNQQGTGHRWTVCGSALIFFFHLFKYSKHKYQKNPHIRIHKCVLGSGSIFQMLFSY